MRGASLNSFTHEIIKTELNKGRPVIFSGFNNNGGHSLVCDGYRINTRCEHIDGYEFYATYRHYWMNWGWNGDGNGWFDYSTWGGLFNTHQEVIHHITP